MRRQISLIAFLAISQITTAPFQVAVNARVSSATPILQTTGGASTTAQQANSQATAFDLAQYGVQIEPEPRLIVVMAALDAAGFDPMPAGTQATPFRAQIKKENAALNDALRTRLKNFYESHKLPTPASAADQAARYVSLAYALGTAPAFEMPTRTDDLPSGLLEVLDFAPLVHEYYNASGIAARLPEYLKLYAAEGERLRATTPEMVRSVLSYLHTRPLTTITERVPVRASAASGKQKNQAQNFTVRERTRRFFIVPDLLAAPGAVNFRVIADDYYAIVPMGTDPAASELRRAYLQYVIDPLVLRFNRDISARREQIKMLLEEKTKSGAPVSPDVFLAVTRSVVAAADARLDEAARLASLTREAQTQLQSAKTEAARAAVVKRTQERRAAISDETIAQLADADERGAVLAFYFADQLRGLESSGFDIANFFADMIASFDPAREKQRVAANADARRRALVARQSRYAQRATAGAVDASRNDLLFENLVEVDDLLRAKNFAAAEAQLQKLMSEYPSEPRIYFALGRAASLSAVGVTDESALNERLTRALERYRMAVKLSAPDKDRALLSRAHEAMGRILTFQDKPEEAIKEFDAAIALKDVPGGAYLDAVAGKQKLAQPK